MKFDRASLQAFADQLRKIKQTGGFNLSSEFYSPTGKTFLIPSNVDANEAPFFDKSHTLGLSEALFDACDSANWVSIELHWLPVALANTVDQMIKNHENAEGSSLTDVTNVLQTLDH